MCHPPTGAVKPCTFDSRSHADVRRHPVGASPRTEDGRHGVADAGVQDRHTMQLSSATPHRPRTCVGAHTSAASHRPSTTFDLDRAHHRRRNQAPTGRPNTVTNSQLGSDREPLSHIPRRHSPKGLSLRVLTMRENNYSRPQVSSAASFQRTISRPAYKKSDRPQIPEAEAKRDDRSYDAMMRIITVEMEKFGSTLLDIVPAFVDKNAQELLKCLIEVCIINVAKISFSSLQAVSALTFQYVLMAFAAEHIILWVRVALLVALCSASGISTISEILAASLRITFSSSQFASLYHDLQLIPNRMDFMRCPSQRLQNSKASIRHAWAHNSFRTWRC